MTARRGVIRAGLLATVVMVAVLTSSARVDADSPSAAGWWTSANPGLPVSISEIPLAVPPGGGAAGTPSDVPEDGLEVATNAQGVLSYAAIGFAAGERAVTSITLQLAPNAVDLPQSQVEACPLTGSGVFTVAHGGPLATGPSYDCQRSVAGVEDASNGVVTFAVGRFVVNGYLGVAIVGVGNTRMVFSPPGASTIRTEESAPPAANEGSTVENTAPSTADAPSPAPAALPSLPPIEPAGDIPPTVDSAAPAGNQTAVAPAPEVPDRSEPVAVTISSVSIRPGGATVGALLVVLLGAGVAVRNRRNTRRIES